MPTFFFFPGKHVISVSVGLGHALALTKQGEVYGWGKNDYKQVCDTSENYIQQPVLLNSLNQQHISGICCGPAQSFVWSDYTCSIPKTRIPFVVDLSEYTFRLVVKGKVFVWGCYWFVFCCCRLLDQLLETICDNKTTGFGSVTIHQDKECITVATLNLLHLQVN